MERQEFKEKAKHRIDELFAKIDELEAKKEKATGETKARYNEMIADIKKLKNDLNEAYRSVESATEKDWKEKKKIFNASLESFQEGFSKLADIFK